MTNKKIPTRIFALGGIEEIGKNMYVIEHADEIFIIDCGIKFADEKVLLGVASIIPPFDYLVENKEKVKALIVTHGHEDHVGGIPYLLKEIAIPTIYASDLSSSIIKRKLKDHHGANQSEFKQITDDLAIKSKHFNIEFFRVCHSIPLSFGVSFKTPNGTIVSTGDFRLDFSTRVEQTDLKKITAIGKKKVDLLLCETTNAEVTGFSLSEEVIISEVRKQIIKAPGRVFITTFASNLSRIENIIEEAINLGKKICIIGKAMDANINASIKIGCLKVSKNEFIEPSALSKNPDDDVVIFLTGSQGEPQAALNTMANGKHANIVLRQNDTVLMSSNPIPGNFLAVENLVNKLTKLNLNVVINSPSNRLHASGHGTEVEQQVLIKLLDPTYVVPIHGEYKMLKALQRSIGFLGYSPEQYIQATNGQVIELVDGSAKLTSEIIDAREVYVDGLKANAVDQNLIFTRKVLSNEGVISATIIIDKKTNQVIGLPVIITRGSFYANTSLPMICKIAHTIKDKINEELVKNGVARNKANIRRIAESTIEFFIWKNKKKKPLIRVSIFY